MKTLVVITVRIFEPMKSKINMTVYDFCGWLSLVANSAKRMQITALKAKFNNKCVFLFFTFFLFTLRYVILPWVIGS